MATISLRTATKNRTKDAQRANDYNSPYGVKFWNRLLREGKMKAKNKKCNDQTLWDAFCHNYQYWGEALKTETNPEKIKKLTRWRKMLMPYFDGTWKQEAWEYYMRIDPHTADFLRIKVKADCKLPDELAADPNFIKKREENLKKYNLDHPYYGSRKIDKEKGILKHRGENE